MPRSLPQPKFYGSTLVFAMSICLSPAPMANGQSPQQDLNTAKDLSTLRSPARASEKLDTKEVAWSNATPHPTWLTNAIEQAKEAERSRAALRKSVVADFKGEPLQAAVQDLSNQAEVALYINATELDLLGVDPDLPVRFRGHASLAEILKLVLDPLELTYHTREFGLEITSKDAANSNPSIRYYDMAWVVDNSNEGRELMQVIESTIDPDSWRSMGGTSSILPIRNVLVVSAPDTTQEKIESLFANLSKLKAAKPALKKELWQKPELIR